MTYHLVYDITTEPAFDWEVAMLSGSLVLIGATWRLIQRGKDRKRIDPPTRPKLSTPNIIIAFGLVVAILSIGLMGWDHWRLVKALDSGEGRVVEGPIQSWGIERVRTARRDKYEYNIYERFYVGDSIWFGYYQNVGQAGFHNAKSALVELRDGMLARATYLFADGMDDPPRTVKLELAE